MIAVNGTTLDVNEVIRNVIYGLSNSDSTDHI